MGNTTSGLVPIDDAGEYDGEQQDDSGYELSEADDEAEDGDADDDHDDGTREIEIATSVGATIEPQGVAHVGPSTLASVVASDSGYIPAFDPAWDSVDEYAGAWGLEPDSESDDYDSSDADTDYGNNEDEHEEEEEVGIPPVTAITSGAQTTPAPAPIPAAVTSNIPGPPSVFPPIPLLRDDSSPHTIGHLILELISSPSSAFASDWPPTPASTLGSTSASTTTTAGYYTGANSGLTLIPDDMSGYVDMDNEFNSFEGRVFGYMVQQLGRAAAMVASGPTRRWLAASGFSAPLATPQAAPSISAPTPVLAPAFVPTTVPVPASAPIAISSPASTPLTPPPTNVQVQVQVKKTEPCWKWKRPLNILRPTASTRRLWRMQVSRLRWWTRVVTREARWCWTRTFMKATPECTAQTGCRIQCSRSRRGGVAGICNAGGLGRCFNAGCPGEGVGQESSHRRPPTTLARSSSHQIPRLWW